MRKSAHSFHVRWRRLDTCAVGAGWSEWIGPVIGAGPFQCARCVVLAEDWSDLPIDLQVEVASGGAAVEFTMTVSRTALYHVCLAPGHSHVHIRPFDLDAAGVHRVCLTKCKEIGTEHSYFPL